MNGSEIMHKEITPFPNANSSYELQNGYLTAEQLKTIFNKSNESQRCGIIRLWITEGVPYAFKDCPMFYEDVRQFIAQGVNVHPKEVTLVGSSRIGYSMKPYKWGKPYSKSSDFDFTIISNASYAKLVTDFQRWVSDIASKNIIPKSKEQLTYWLSSIDTVNRNIPKGYIYTKNLFSHKNYLTVSKCFISMKNLKEKISKTPDFPQASDVSIRVYSSWDTCIKQVKFNLQSSIKYQY